MEELTQELLDDEYCPHVKYLGEKFIDMRGKIEEDGRETMTLMRQDGSKLTISLEEWRKNGSLCISLDPRLEYSMNRLRVGFKSGMRKYRNLKPEITDTDEDFYENQWSGYSRENYIPYLEYLKQHPSNFYNSD